MNRPDFPDDADVIFQFGEPFLRKGINSVSLNPNFFAGKFLKDYPVVYYDPGEWYLRYDSRRKKLDAKELRRKLYAMLMTAVKEADLSLFDRITDGLLNEVIAKIRMMVARERPVLDPDDIPIKNGLLHWVEEMQDFIFRAYTSEDNFLWTLDVEYHPEAHSPYFDEKIIEILPDPDNRHAVQAYLGACLFSQNLTRKILVFQGEGGCGKSRLPVLLTQILTGRRVFELNVTAIRQSYELSSLEDQTLFTAPESVADTFCEPAGINFQKMITGGDFFETKQKFRNAKVQHWGNYGVIVMTNHTLKFKFDGRGEEFKDRILLVIFDQHVPEERQDRELSNRFYVERDAIFNWFLEGARRVRRNKWNIELTPEQKSRRDRLIEASKGIEIFVCNHVRRSAGDSFSAHDAYEVYLKLSNRDGFEYLEEPTFQKRLAKAMALHFGICSTNTLKGGKARGYRDVEIVC